MNSRIQISQDRQRQGATASRQTPTKYGQCANYYALKRAECLCNIEVIAIIIMNLLVNARR